MKKSADSNSHSNNEGSARIAAIPVPALLLGVAGLIPFVVSATGGFIAEPYAGFFHRALVIYGAVILSFLGGVRWGVLLNDRIAMQAWPGLIMSVLPSLVGFSALLLPFELAVLLLAAAFLVQYWLDSEGTKSKLLPDWYLSLRIILTTGAVISLLTGLI